MIDEIVSLTPEIILALIILGIWELIWKGIALWKCGRNNQLTWFVFILILNTAGILPIIYIAFFQERPKNFKVKANTSIKKINRVKRKRK